MCPVVTSISFYAIRYNEMWKCLQVAVCFAMLSNANVIWSCVRCHAHNVYESNPHLKLLYPACYQTITLGTRETLVVNIRLWTYNTQFTTAKQCFQGAQKKTIALSGVTSVIRKALELKALSVKCGSCMYPHPPL